MSGGSSTPTEKDLPTVVSLAPDADLSVLDTAKIIAAPAEPADRKAWRTALARWRDGARARIGYDDNLYRSAATEWTRQCFSVCLAWIWDDTLYDRASGRFTVDEFLAHGEREFGGYDAVVLWHAYPIIGLDERNQFDFYRGVPGLDELVAELHNRGVRVAINYNPWDTGTRREPASDAQLIAELVRRLGVDVVFLDTMREGGADIAAASAEANSGSVLETEGSIPLDRIADHAMSWGQWFADGDVPGVIRAKWFEQRHLVHHIRRWHRDHSGELHSAWMNGCGVMVWENVFGSWVGWNARDRALLRAMLPVQRHFADLFSLGEWTPLVDEAESRLPTSRWEHAGVVLWTVVNRSTEPYTGPLVGIRVQKGIEYYDAIAGRRLGPDLAGELPGLGLAAVVAVPHGRALDGFTELLAEQQNLAWVDDTSFPSRVVHPIRPGVTKPGDLPRIPAGKHQLTIAFTVRETGFDGGAPFVDMWRPSAYAPDLHVPGQIVREVEIGTVGVATHEVTNGEYAQFLAASGYAPRNADRFLAHWSDNAPAPGIEDAAVTYVDLDDARAYAEWAGLRLPTDDEWQVAAEAGMLERRQPLVWNWTESEYSDGRTTYVFLKGGSAWKAEGTVWYVDGGLEPATHALKLLRSCPPMERSPNVGFRCACDVE